MTKIAEPGGYQREAGAVFGSGTLRSCPACEQMPCSCWCRCCHNLVTMTKGNASRRCDPCRMRCNGKTTGQPGHACAVAKKGGA